MGGEWSLGVALVMECWPERWRPLLAGVIGAAANLGYALIAALALKFPVQPDSWRWVMLAGAAPALLTFLIRLFVPESERWKESVKDQKARPGHELFGPKLASRTCLAIAFAAVALIGTWGSVQWIPVWVDQLTGGEIPRAKAWAQLLSAGGAIVGCLIGPLVGAWLGRRPAYFGLCLLSLLSCAYLYRMGGYSNGLLAMIFVVGATTAAFYGWLPLYLPELFPTRVRATGQGLSFNSGRVLAAVGAVYAGELVSHYEGDYAQMGTTITLIYIVGMVIIWLAPETKGKPLPD
jgi:MFS family permease